MILILGVYEAWGLILRINKGMCGLIEEFIKVIRKFYRQRGL